MRLTYGDRMHYAPPFIGRKIPSFLPFIQARVIDQWLWRYRDSGSYTSLVGRVVRTSRYYEQCSVWPAVAFEDSC